MVMYQNSKYCQIKADPRKIIYNSNKNIYYDLDDLRIKNIYDDSLHVFDNVPFNEAINDCSYCGKPRTEEGHDACLGRLNNVSTACCGHGEGIGFIEFENGRKVFLIDAEKLGGIEAYREIEKRYEDEQLHSSG